jgi:hypothetical protein
MPSAVSVEASTVPAQGTGPGASPRTALQHLVVRPVPFRVAKEVLVKHHYLHSIPGGTQLTFGVFLNRRLMGAVALSVGPTNAFRLVTGATRGDCMTLSRFWLSDELPFNSESRVLGIVLRALRRHTCVRFLIAYADPSEDHVGTVYQASGWQYTGLSQATPLYMLGGARPRHSRSFAHAYGSHSIAHFAKNGVTLRAVPQQGKHRYVYFLAPTWRCRLTVPVMPYPRKESSNEHC